MRTVLVVTFCFPSVHVCSRLSSFSALSPAFPTGSYASVSSVPLFMSFKIPVFVRVHLFLICINDTVL